MPRIDTLDLRVACSRFGPRRNTKVTTNTTQPAATTPNATM